MNQMNQKNKITDAPKRYCSTGKGHLCSNCKMTETKQMTTYQCFVKGIMYVSPYMCNTCMSEKQQNDCDYTL